ncbi:MAG TPA: DUF2378 family protein [Polyangiales bacterium]|nr:DUF2378 family protein [Polyangiales bacterium]
MTPDQPTAAGAADTFIEPPWGAPLDHDAALRAIPDDAQISGMFTAPLVAESKRIKPLPDGSRERYVAFQFYPLREHARWLVDTAHASYPNLPLRGALRKLGRGAPAAFLASTLGKVMLESATSWNEFVAAFCKAYALNLRPGRAVVLDSQANRLVVRLEDVHYFIDSHHVGVFEGLMKHSQLRGHVRVRMRGRASADLQLEW